MDDLVTLATFQNPVYADIAKGKLESEGIAAYLFDENIGGATTVYSGSVGWVKLMVKQSDLEKAAAILRENVSEAVSNEADFMGSQADDENITEDIAEVNSEPSPDSAPLGLAQCPRCRSANISIKNLPPWAIFLSWLFLGFPFLFLRRRWSCLSCGYRWKSL